MLRFVSPLLYISNSLRVRIVVGPTVPSTVAVLTNVAFPAEASAQTNGRGEEWLPKGDVRFRQVRR